MRPKTWGLVALASLVLAACLFVAAANERAEGARAFHACQGGFECTFVGFLEGVELYAGGLLALCGAAVCAIAGVVSRWRSRRLAPVDPAAELAWIERELAEMDK